MLLSMHGTRLTITPIAPPRMYQCSHPEAFVQLVEGQGWLRLRRRRGMEHARLRSAGYDHISVGHNGCITTVGKTAEVMLIVLYGRACS